MFAGSIVVCFASCTRLQGNAKVHGSGASPPCFGHLTGPSVLGELLHHMSQRADQIWEPAIFLLPSRKLHYQFTETARYRNIPPNSSLQSE